ncbi:MAG: sugar kinase [Candidatus Melainabacteria bacterium]
MIELSCKGSPRLTHTFSKAVAGDTLNTVVAASRLGSGTGYITRFGDDPFAVTLRETMLAESVDIRASRVAAGRQTGMYIVAIDEATGERDFHYYRTHSAASTLGPEDIQPNIIRGSKIVYATGVTMGISESARKAVVKAFTLAREHDVITAFDPNYRAALWDRQEGALDALVEIMPLVDVMMPTVPDDTLPILGFSRPEQVVEYFQFKDIKLVVAKAGADGCYLGYKRKIEHIPAIPAKAVDTTGAGDAFNAGFLHGLAQDRPLQECAQIGNATAGLKILNRGTLTAMPNREAVYAKVYSLV